jgi:hypothetical protein
MGIELKNYSLNASKTSMTLSTEDLATGTYFYTLETTKGQRSTGKFILLK